MSERLTRKEIKQDIRQDEVQSFLLTAVEKVQENPSLYIGAVVGLLALGLGVTGVFAYLDSRAETANERLADAMEIYGAPVVEDGEAKPDDPDEPSFASEDARRDRARQVFAEVEGGAAGAVADLYEAEFAIEEGDTAKARQIWESFLSDHGDHVLAMSVRINLIHLDRQEGEAEALAQQLQTELDSAEKSLPEDVILYELARTRDHLGQTDEAQELYQRILDEYPQSPYAADARRLTTAAG